MIDVSILAAITERGREEEWAHGEPRRQPQAGHTPIGKFTEVAFLVYKDVSHCGSIPGRCESGKMQMRGGWGKSLSLLMVLCCEGRGRGLRFQWSLFCKDAHLFLSCLTGSLTLPQVTLSCHLQLPRDAQQCSSLSWAPEGSAEPLLSTSPGPGWQGASTTITRFNSQVQRPILSSLSAPDRGPGDTEDVRHRPCLQ